MYEFRPKKGDSPLIQIADLYLWPMCIGGYDRMNRPYRELMDRGKLIDAVCDDSATQGIKYFCFENVIAKL